MNDAAPRLRLNLVMSEKTKRRLDRLVRLTEADTNAEVIRNALRLYEVIIDHILNEQEFLIRDKKTGQITSYDPFISVKDEPENSPVPNEPNEKERGRARTKLASPPRLG